MAIMFLDIEKVLRIHRSMIEAYGGSEGLRDIGLLHSALAMPGKLRRPHAPRGHL